MHKEEYDKLLKRFALELSEVGVTDDLIKVVQAQYERTPNLIGANSNETTERFTYRHGGYIIEATRTVSLQVKKCS